MGSARGEINGRSWPCGLEATWLLGSLHRLRGERRNKTSSFTFFIRGANCSYVQSSSSIFPTNSIRLSRGLPYTGNHPFLVPVVRYTNRLSPGQRNMGSSIAADTVFNERFFLTRIFEPFIFHRTSLLLLSPRSGIDIICLMGLIGREAELTTNRMDCSNLSPLTAEKQREGLDSMNLRDAFFGGIELRKEPLGLLPPQTLR